MQSRRPHHRRGWWLWPVLSLLLAGLAWPTRADNAAASQPVQEYAPQPAQAWMTLLYERVEAEGVSAPAASRIYGYAAVTLYESLLGGLPDNVTLAGQIVHLPDLPLWNEDQVYDWVAVMHGAMATVLPRLFVEPEAATVQAFRDRRAAGLAALEDTHPQVRAASLAYGETLGRALLDWIARDGFQEAHAGAGDYVLPEGQELYRLTAEGTQPVEPYWGELRTLVLGGGFECAIFPDVPFSTDPDSTFYQQALEVVEVGRGLTEWQRETAAYWVDTPGQTGTPAGHWVSIATQLIDQYEMNLRQAAMLYTMVGLAVHDAFISGWAVKYDVMLPRPVTYIREHIRRRWSPYIETPPFPEYPSGHSIVSAAAAEVLTGLLGARAFEDQTHILFSHSPLTRRYTSFEAAAQEAAISRLYGGIHYRSAIENGMRQGRCIGTLINQRILLSPLSQGE
ncbi:MAG: vanadium-dependent haloperoxidase [Anaerolineae bacterium]|nr:vanadium-dependent haloperoxidase [Anaerolineae bacterium]